MDRRVDDDPPLRRWMPIVFVVVACAIVVTGLGAAVYVAKTTPPDRTSATTTRTAPPDRLHGQACIALGVVALGSPAAAVGGGYRLHVEATDSRSCVLRPSDVALVAQQGNGAKRVFATPRIATRAGPLLKITYTVTFSPRCARGHGSAQVLLSIGGSQFEVPGATIPAGLANCRRVTMTATTTR